MDRRPFHGLPFLLCAAFLAGGAAPLGAAESEARLEPAPRPPGVTAEVERAIERGIKYLVTVRQREPGRRQSWWGMSSSSYQGRRARNRTGDEIYRCAMTGLAGLALLAHGNTPTRGPEAEVVDETTEFLLACATSSGLITSGADEERPMYSHAFATTFLAQVYGHEVNPARRERMRKVIHKAIDLTIRAQTDDGGWGYVPNYTLDEGTLTVTQLQGLRACRDAGFIVPRKVVDRGVDFIKASANDDGSVCYRVGDSRIRPGVTCAAVVALWNAGQYDSDLFRSIRDFVNANIRHRWDDLHHAEYVAYYLAQAKWVQGGGEWERYYPAAADAIVRDQQRDGSWLGYEGSEVYSTAIALIILQLPYSFLPVYQR